MVWYGIVWRGMVWQIVARAMVWAYGRLWRVSEVTVYWFPSPTGSMQRGSVGHLHALTFEIQNTDDKSRNTLRFSANSQTSSIQRTAPLVQFICRWKLSKIQKCKYTWAVSWLRGHLPPYKGQLPMCSSSANTLGLSVDYEGTFLHTKERTPSCIVCTLLLLLKLWFCCILQIPINITHHKDCDPWFWENTNVFNIFRMHSAYKK